MGLVGDAKAILNQLLGLIRQADRLPEHDPELVRRIAQDKIKYREDWQKHKSPKGQVNPVHFFNALNARLAENAIIVLDDGNHTYLAAELLALQPYQELITPTDFNAMGYATPAAIGAKLANSQKDVWAIVGDGCFAMTALEMLTAKSLQIGVIYCVFKDGELSQIAQAQAIPYGHKACSILPGIDLSGVAKAVNAQYLAMNGDNIDAILDEAMTLVQKQQCVIVDIDIDYSRATAFTKGTSKSTFKGFETRDKWRFVKRALGRKFFGK